MEKLGKMDFLSFSLLILASAVLRAMAAGSDYPPPCESKIYCHGPLLHTIQMAGLFKDSKTFVDMKMKYSPAQVLKNFDMFMDKHGHHPGKSDISKFVNSNFEAEGSEFEPWDPTDWHEDPQFLRNISDTKYRTWASELHSFWKELGRKIKDDVKIRPDMYSMIYSDHPVIVPGGRFREIFYWDSFWIMRGLLLSEMHTTVRGMLLNLLNMVSDLGYVPNGGRIYFRRSQPPLLVPMFKLYMDATNDVNFLRDNIAVLEKEFQFWIRNRTININVNGKPYEVVRYNVELDGPRPESYREDFELAETLKKEEDKRELYFNLKSAAESGWDFSSRWFIPPEGDTGKLIHTKTRHVIPVELNSFMFLNAKTLAEFHEQLGNKDKTMYYRNIANKYRTTIEDVFWDDEEGSWFDYDMIHKDLRRTFYASNMVPLWVGAYSSTKTVNQVVSYLTKTGMLKERGGVPTSPIQSGEQWDYPNGWAPLQYFIVDALAKTDDKKAQAVAFELADKWIKTNYKAFLQSQPNHMFEKYDVTVEGIAGGGGEYEVVVGFGWTNGVVMDFLHRYGDRLRVPMSNHQQLEAAANAPHTVIEPGTAIGIGSIALAITSLLGVLKWRTHKANNTITNRKVSTPTKVQPNYKSVDAADHEETAALMQEGTISPSGDQDLSNNNSDSDLPVCQSPHDNPSVINTNSYCHSPNPKMQEVS